jgi:hypothetical protein
MEGTSTVFSSGPNNLKHALTDYKIILHKDYVTVDKYF